MKRLFTTMLLTSVAAFVGCTKEGTTGGPGATDTGTKPPLVGRQDNTFAVTTSTITVKPAAPATLGTIGIKRGTGFDQAVTIELADLPKGVTVDPATGTIPAGATEVKFNFLAAEGAVPSDYVVKVTAKPTTGANSTGDFKLTVKNPDTFSISVPFWTTGIKQGETKQFSLAVKRDVDFKEDIALKFDALPKGLTIEPATATVKGAETEAKFLVKAADDAPVGDHVVKVTGTPSKGTLATHDLKISIGKK